MIKKISKLGRKFTKFLAAGLLAAILVIALVPTSTAMAAEVTTSNSQLPEFPTEIAESYSQLADNTVMPRTSYFIPDQEFSFRGTYVIPSFSIPSACQARLVIAAIGNEPLYIDVLNGKLQTEHSMVIAPNQSQVQIFNITAGTHYLQFSSITGSQFTVRLQMYTWDY